DEVGRIRVDDWEMEADVQAAVAKIWPDITSENLNVLSDFSGYQNDFLELFGFGLKGVDYDADVEVDVPMPSHS
ncbi:MAG: bifunctional NADH-specific enoyl-ACP reductase/trans-2-enoyl-CoA reductase, partial [Opitutales bacterium]|nr:bifunctional NADH-specific enoyl-ACP reductase/trans-2-enoyl-CoA reductase [Opitutales bacterium]